MPFKKVGPNRYVSPSGRIFTSAQVALYYATDGFTKTVANHPVSKPHGKDNHSRHRKKRK